MFSVSSAYPVAASWEILSWSGYNLNWKLKIPMQNSVFFFFCFCVWECLNRGIQLEQNLIRESILLLKNVLYVCRMMKLLNICSYNVFSAREFGLGHPWPLDWFLGMFQLFDGNKEDDWYPLATVFATHWCIWKARNAVIFNSYKAIPGNIVKHLVRGFQDWSTTNVCAKEYFRICVKE